MADISNIKVGEQNYTIGLSDDDMSRVKRMTAGTEEKLANTGASTADVVPSITLNSEWDEENSIWKPFKFVTPFAASEMPKKLNVSLIFYYGKEDTDNIYPETNGKPPIDFTNLSITFTCANTDYTVDQDHWDITSFIDEYQDGFIYYPSGFAKLELIICCEQDFTAGTYKFSAYPTYDVSQIYNKFDALNTHLTEIDKTITNKNSLKLNGTTNDIMFGIDSNGNYGYIKAGADTVIPFRKGECELILNHVKSNGSGSGSAVTTRAYTSVIVICMGGGTYAEASGSVAYATVSCSSYSTAMTIFSNLATLDSNTRGERSTAKIFYSVPKGATINVSHFYEGWGIAFGIY